MLPGRVSAAIAGLALAALACTLPGGAESTPTTYIIPTIGPTMTLTPSGPTVTLAPTPTQFIPPTPVRFAICPDPGSATLPANPPAFADYATTIEAYLSGGGSIEGLQTTLMSWGGLTDFAGEVIANRDLTGDSTPEVIVAVQAPFDQFQNTIVPPGDLYVFECSNSAYQIIFGDYSTPDRPTPDIISADDLNQNGRGDLLYTVHYCGASTCSYDVHAVEWNADTLVFSEILPEIKAVPEATVTVSNQDGGAQEVIVANGGYGSVGAGPQRLTSSTYAWNGTSFELGGTSITTPVEQWYPIHYLMDADALMDQGEYQQAIRTYQQMIGLQNPSTLNTPDELPVLRAYARFRIMIAHILLRNQNAAREVHDALFAEYEASPALPGGGFAAMADIFWDRYSGEGGIQGACSAVISYASANPTSYDLLNTFGYANKVYEAADLCPFQ